MTYSLFQELVTTKTSRLRTHQLSCFELLLSTRTLNKTGDCESAVVFTLVRKGHLP